MRVKVRISISHWSDDAIDMKEIMAPLLYDKIGYPVKYGSLETSSPVNGKWRPRTHHYFDVFTDDERYGLLKKQLEVRGVKFLEHGEKIFEESELAAAEFLQLGAAGHWGYPQPEESREEWQKASFDLTTACPICGYGAIQDRPYLIKGEPKLGRNSLIGLNWTYDFLVTDELKNLIEREELTGAEFWPLIRYKKGVPLRGYHQLYIRDELPSMSPNTQIVAVSLKQAHDGCPCPNGKIGRMLSADPVTHVLVPMRYKRSALRNAKDFNLTKEWLSYGYDATRWCIVSSRVYTLFVNQGIRGGAFEPVTIEDK